MATFKEVFLKQLDKQGYEVVGETIFACCAHNRDLGFKNKSCDECDECSALDPRCYAESWEQECNEENDGISTHLFNACLKPKSVLADSGAREVFSTGGVREPKDSSFEQLPAIALYRLAKHFYNGEKKYGKRNWQKGIKWSSCVNAIFRHTIKFMIGSKDEDHLAAIMWNAATLCEYEVTHPELNDLQSGELDEETLNKIRGGINV